MNSDDTPEPSGKSGPEDTTQALREKAQEAGYWHSEGKPRDRTLHSAILRERDTKGRGALRQGRPRAVIP